MYHSITFDGEVNTWDDWHLIPATRPVFNPPETKTHYVDIPGANGQIDLTESLTGYPVYENRTGSIEFYVANGYEDWDVIYSKILSYLHGKTHRAYPESESNGYFYYEGRFEVNKWTSDKWYSKITIDYDVYPYRKEPYSSTESWLWDPFDFELGIVREYGDLVVDGTLEMTIDGRQEPIVPEITVDSDDGSGMTVKVGSTIYELEDGVNVIPSIVVSDESVTLTFTGNGSVNIEYRGGLL